MKKIFSGICMALLITGCDDGDLDIERVDFSDAEVELCPDNFDETGLLFKITQNEALILELERGFITNEATQDSIESDIPGASKLYYRFFDDEVSSNYFCSTVAPATPKVVQEVVATGGTIRALTTPKSDGSGFNHGIIIYDAVLMNDAKERIIEDEFSLGSFSTEPSPASIGATFGNVIQCNDTLIYKAGTGNNDIGVALVLDLKEGLLKNEVTEEDTPRTGIIADDSRVLFYIFDSALPENYFCLEEKPNTPIEEGMFEATQGLIEVTTTETESGNGFIHQISFKNMLLLNDENERLVGASATFGSLTVTTAGGS